MTEEEDTLQWPGSPSGNKREHNIIREPNVSCVLRNARALRLVRETNIIDREFLESIKVYVIIYNSFFTR